MTRTKDDALFTGRFDTPRIGCAGWSIASAHSALFGEVDSVLARYATRFNAVEINSSFYRPHQNKTYMRWADSVPENFRFSAKIPKAITHEARLQGEEASLDKFLSEISGLGEKLGGLLVQLPPSLRFDTQIASTFFSTLRQRTSVPLACEPRHVTWFTGLAEEVLMREQVTRVAADPAPIANSNHVAGKGPWRYWRWHGSPQMYYSNYTDAVLEQLAETVRTETPDAVAPWIIFDNTASGHATTNALKMQRLLPG